MKNQKIQLLKDEKISIALLKLGVPTMLGMLITALYNVVDAYFIAGLGTSEIGAISICYPVGQVIIGFGMLFGCGAASYLSRLLGEKRKQDADRCASSALFSSLFVGIILIIIIQIFMNPMLRALGATDTILPFAKQYAVIYISGCILSIFNVTMNNIVVSEGASKLTMISMLLGAVCNIVLDPIMIYNMNLKISGAAYATLIAQAVTSAIYLGYILLNKSIYKFSIKNFSFDKKIYTEIIKIGMPILTYTILTSLSISLTNLKASVYGDSFIAAMGIVTRIMALGTMAVFGFLKGFQPFVGYNYGAKNYIRISEGIKTALIYSTIFCIVLAATLIIFPQECMSLFSNGNTSINDIGVTALIANGIILIGFGLQQVYAAYYMAIGKAKKGSILLLSRQGIFFVPVILILPLIFNKYGIIYAQPLADLFSVVLALILAVTDKNLKCSD